MFTFGFYNSYNGDRKYSSEQMSAIFDGIINDGVFANYGEHFEVTPGTGMQVIVKTGRAWFKHTWNLNDTWMVLDLDASDVLRSRIDSVVLEVNSNTLVRENSIKIIKGELASNPVAPTMIHADGVDQYRLADITVGVGVKTIIEANIANKIGMGETPFVTAPLQVVDISYLFSEWNGQFDDWLDKSDTAFQEWFANIKAQLAGDVAANLQNQIDARVKIEDMATANDINNGTPGKWIDANLANSDLFGITKGLKIGDIVYSSRDLETETNGMLIKCDQRELKIDEYPELCNTEDIRLRIGTSAQAINPPELYRTSSSDLYETHDLFVYGGFMRGEYIYRLYYTRYNNSTSYPYVINLARLKIDDPSTGYEEYFTNIGSSSNTSVVIVRWYMYESDEYIYIIPVAGPITYNEWYRINKTTLELKTFTDSTNNILCEASSFYGAYMAPNGNFYVIGRQHSRDNIICTEYSDNFNTKKIYTTLINFGSYFYTNFISETPVKNAYDNILQTIHDNKLYVYIIYQEGSTNGPIVAIDVYSFDIINKSWDTFRLNMSSIIPNDMKTNSKYGCPGVMFDGILSIFIQYQNASGRMQTAVINIDVISKSIVKNTTLDYNIFAGNYSHSTIGGYSFILLKDEYKIYGVLDSHAFNITSGNFCAATFSLKDFTGTVITYDINSAYQFAYIDPDIGLPIISFRSATAYFGLISIYDKEKVNVSTTGSGTYTYYIFAKSPNDISVKEYPQLLKGDTSASITIYYAILSKKNNKLYYIWSSITSTNLVFRIADISFRIAPYIPFGYIKARDVPLERKELTE